MADFLWVIFYPRVFRIVAAFEKPYCLYQLPLPLISSMRDTGWGLGVELIVIALQGNMLFPLSLQGSKHVMQMDVISHCLPFWARHYYHKHIHSCPPASWVVNGVYKGNLDSQQETSLTQQGSNRFKSCVWTLGTFRNPVVFILRSRSFPLPWPQSVHFVSRGETLVLIQPDQLYWFKLSINVL